MRFNERQVCLLAQEIPDLEDRLYLKKKSPGSFKKEGIMHLNAMRTGFPFGVFIICRLLLFVHGIGICIYIIFNRVHVGKIADTGQVSEEPDGVIFLADCIARAEYDGGAPFTFSLTFGGTFDKILILATRDQEALSKWISAVNKASYDLLRQRVTLLRHQLAVAKN